jgi:hypothetical protein
MTRPMNIVQLKEQNKQSEKDIRKDERDKMVDKLELLLCSHHKYVGSYRVITGTPEEIYDELFDAMQELRKGELK